MPQKTIITGSLLIVLGILAYVVTNAASVTALIPSFFGLPLLVSGIIALKNEQLRRHAMHAAVFVALLGFLGTVGAIRFALYLISVGPTHVDNPPAVITRSIMAIICGAYLYFSIRSFIDARRSKS